MGLRDLSLPTGWETWPEPKKEQLRDRLRYANFQITYEDDPVAFIHDCFEWPEGQGPTGYQDDALGKLQEKHRLALRGPHGIGKTFIASAVVLWFSLTRDGDDWKALTTASVWRQLEKYLWPEIHKWARILRWDMIGRAPFDEVHELQSLNLVLDTGAASAIASNNPAAIEGAHADRMLYVYDESKNIDDDTFDASEGAFSGAGPDTPREAFALALSTPGDVSGRFYDIHRKAPGLEDWATRHVTLPEAIEAGRVSKEWAAARARQWGEGSSIYQNRVLGEFASAGENTVIPLAWVEAAQERWRALGVETTKKSWVIPEEHLGKFTCSGVDIADEGGDQTVIALRYGEVISELRRYPMGNTMETTGRVVAIQRKLGGYAVVDVIGLGAGPVARLKELKQRVVPFNAAEGSKATDESGELEFANKRAEAWWGLRESLDPAKNPTRALPPDDELTADLTAPTWKMTSTGKILIESKDDIRKRIGRSTDVGDAVVMAYWGKWRPLRTSQASDVRLPPSR